MIKQYKVDKVFPIDGGKTDDYGNVAANVIFTGEKSVFYRTKNLPQIGDVLTGEIEDVPKKSGEGTYRKFVKKKPEETFRGRAASPELNASIEWQKSIAEGRQAVRDWLELQILAGRTAPVYSFEAYKKEIVNAAVTFASTIHSKPTELIEGEQESEPAAEPTPANDDLPPVELYDQSPE